MQIYIGWLVEVLRCSEIVDKAIAPMLVSQKRKSGKKAEAMIERFNNLSFEQKIEFLNAASTLSWFSKRMVRDIGTVEINTPKLKR